MTKGIGSKSIETKGEISIFVYFCGIRSQVTMFQVVDDSLIGHPIILGWSFCKSQKQRIDSGNERIIAHNPDGSTSNISLVKETGEVEKIMHENIKVYAAEDVIIDSRSSLKDVKVNFAVNIQDHDSYFYNGDAKNNQIQGIQGILGGNEANRFVLAQKKNCLDTNPMKIKRGDVLGTVHTILEVEDEEGDTSTWDVPKLKENIKVGDLNLEQKTEVVELLFKVNKLLCEDDFDVGLAGVTPHVIQITENTAIWQKPRTFSDHVNKEIDRQCQELEMMDIIERCHSEWSSPVVPVRKSDGSLRLCIDYRKVNKVTKRENFPIPNLLDSIYSAHKVKYFSKLDLVKGYYHIPIDDASRKYTSFSTTNQQYQFKRLPFGLRNSGIQFQRNMQEILSEFLHKRIIVYQDDILLMSESYEEHIELLKKVLSTLMRAGIKVKVSKCEFFKKRVSFLGHEISTEGI